MLSQLYGLLRLRQNLVHMTHLIVKALLVGLLSGLLLLDHQNRRFFPLRRRSPLLSGFQHLFRYVEHFLTVHRHSIRRQLLCNFLAFLHHRCWWQYLLLQWLWLHTFQ